jgi:hypothetical protein
LAAAVAVGLVAISSWLAAAEYRGVVPGGDFAPRYVEKWMLTGGDAAARRLDAIARATFDLPADAVPSSADGADSDGLALAGPVPACRFVETAPSGTTPKFECVFEGGQTVKVKYGRNPEVQAEVAATRLLRMLGYASDDVIMVPRLRCYGCPRHPYIVAQLRSTLGLPALAPVDTTSGYTDFEWVAIERKFPAPSIETGTEEGWAWWEMKRSQMPRADIDALRLTAMFLAHWDNKAGNQRLVCLDGTPPPDRHCARPLAMMQDLGATFGPLKVNVARWHDLPVWDDRAACTISMRALPFGGATFPDARISEAGRRQFAARLAAITDADIERLFADARFPQYQVGTDGQRDLTAWSDAFRHRRDQIINAGPCPEDDTPRH